MPEELNSYYREPLEIHTMCVREGHLFQKVALTQKAKTFTCTFFENVWRKLDLHFIGFDTVKLIIYT